MGALVRRGCGRLWAAAGSSSSERGWVAGSARVGITGGYHTRTEHNENYPAFTPDSY